MPNNTHHDTAVNSVQLGGWLTIDEVRSVSLDGRGEGVSISGWIHAQKKTALQNQPVDTRYPVIIAGGPASTVLAWAKKRPNQPIKVLVSGRLFRRNGQCMVRVRFVEILEVVTGTLDDSVPERNRRGPLPAR